MSLDTFPRYNVGYRKASESTEVERRQYGIQGGQRSSGSLCSVVRGKDLDA